MKKIKVTIIATAVEEYPGCADILDNCAEIEVVARPGRLYAPGVWAAVSCSDVLVLDEASLERGGATVLHAVHQCHPLVKLLLIVDTINEHKVLDALAMGIGGIVERASLVSMVRKAIPAIYAGETWVSRTLVPALHAQLLRLDGDALPCIPAAPSSIFGKLN